jgi:hypothetical protein
VVDAASEADGPPSPSIEGGASDAPASPVRDCGSHLTKANPAKLVFMVPKLATVSLGEGLDLSKTPPTLGVAYATGNVAQSDADSSTGNAGDDYPADTMFPIAGKYDLFQDDVGGATPLTTLAASIAASNVGTTYSVSESLQGEGWWLNAVSLTAKAPSPPGGNDGFILSLQSSTFFDYAFAIQFDDPCKMGALADALGTRAKAADVLAQASSPAVAQVLVENGAQLTIAVVANKDHPAVDALFAASDAGSPGTACAADDLPACSAVMKALGAEAQSWAATPESVDLDAIAAGTDPAWSFVAFDFASLP